MVEIGFQWCVSNEKKKLSSAVRAEKGGKLPIVRRRGWIV